MATKTKERRGRDAAQEELELAVEVEQKKAGGNGGNGKDSSSGPAPAKAAFQHLTAVRCPRCGTLMKANGTRTAKDGKDGVKQLKRWLCPCAVCRRAHETVGVRI